jgi:uroporphyrinogen decarboxylase
MAAQKGRPTPIGSKRPGTAAPKPKRREMNRYERVWAAVNGDEVDRPPVCFWHHFHPAGSGQRLADATLEFFDEEFELDIMKIMPDIPYPFPHKTIRQPEDWLAIEPIDPGRSRYMTQRIEAVQTVREAIGIEAPVVMTTFSPLAEAMYFCADHATFLQHAQEHPAVVHEALSIIADNLRTQNQLMIDAGADGIFFALQGCSREIMPEALYREFGRPYDLMALQGAREGWLNILHIHGAAELMFDAVLGYPVSVLSWSDRIAGPSLREARSKTSLCLMGGWSELGPLTTGPVEKIREEALDAVKQTGGRKFILASGCSVPDDTDHDILEQARDIVEELAL